MYKYDRQKIIFNDEIIKNKYEIDDKLNCLKNKWDFLNITSNQGFDNNCEKQCKCYSLCNKIINDKECIKNKYPVILNVDNEISAKNEKPKVNLYINNIDSNPICPQNFLLAKNIYDAKKILKSNIIDKLVFNYDISRYKYNLFLNSYNVINDICVNKYKINNIYIANEKLSQKKEIFDQLKSAQDKNILDKNIKIFCYGF